MNILMASPEMEPFAQTGGLGDVLGAFPGALAAEGHRVSVVLPMYRVIDREKYDLVSFGSAGTVQFGDYEKKYKAYKTTQGLVDVYFIDNPGFFDRDNLYSYSSGDYSDNAERFIFFSRTVVDLASRLGHQLHIIHSHDWQTGLVPLYQAALDKEYPRLSKTASVFTIHNMGYQGLFPQEAMRTTALSRSVFTPEGLEFYGKMNLLKGGIVFSDAVTTVSARYAEEIQTEQYGCGLHELMRTHRGKLSGILNGAGYKFWNPATDKLLPCNYTPSDNSGKARCKLALQRETGLPAIPSVPVIGMVTRLAEHKGIDLLAVAIEKLINLEIQLVVLGTGDKAYEDMIRAFSMRFPDRFVGRVAFDKQLSHLIQAGSDFFLMPSRYEPCGLSQIYSLKYGTVPIVRATGGLDDTVIDVREDPERGTGFKFNEYSAEAMTSAVAEAIDYYRQRPGQWQRIKANAFAADFGWERSARLYLDLYRETFKKKSGKYPPGPRNRVADSPGK
jgi:starch synthase